MNPFFGVALRLMLVLLVLAPLVHTLKVARLSYEVGAWTFYIGFPAVTALLGLAVISSKKRISGSLVPWIVFFIIISVYVIVPTLFNGGAVEDIAGNVTRYAFVILLLSAVALTKGYYSSIVDEKLRKIAIIMLLVSAASIVLMYWFSYRGYSVYYGLQSTSALISFAYGLVYRRNAMLLLSVAIILLSGKRGVMLGAIAGFFLYAFVLMGQRRAGRMLFLTTLVAGLATVVVALGLTPEAISNRFAVLSPDGQMDVDSLLSGRFTEGEQAVLKLESEPVGWVTGYGLGSAVEAEGQSKSTVHFSPLAMVMQIGLPMTLALYLFMGYQMWRSTTFAVRNRDSRNYLVMLVIFFAEFVFSFSAFTLLQSYALWLSFAYLCETGRNSRSGG